RFGAAGADEALVERFYREARTAATFTHPHLCPVHDFGRIEGIHFLTMPLLNGEPLSARLGREGALPERSAAQLAAPVAPAPAVPHPAGVIHRDLKPATLMIAERGQPIVMDFGLARRELPGDPRASVFGLVVGTPAYSPPEQIGGEPGGMGPACDVYS